MKLIASYSDVEAHAEAELRIHLERTMCLLRIRYVFWGDTKCVNVMVKKLKD
jgi:hypothetical protein